MTHIWVSKLTIIGSDNGLSPSRRQAIIWTNAGILLIRNKLQWNLNRNSNIFIEENTFEIGVWKMAAILSRPQCVNWPGWEFTLGWVYWNLPMVNDAVVLGCRARSRLAPSQWETWLQCNAVSHWLGANLKSALGCDLWWTTDGECPNYFQHDDVIKWKHFLSYWPFARVIHQSLVNSPHKGQCALRFSLAFVLIINSWANNCEAGDLRHYHAHYDVIVMEQLCNVEYSNSVGT